MGIVYAAVHRGLKRRVALKLLAQDLASAEEYRSRFAREAEILARLDSPHIIRVYDAGEHDGIFYIATQLVEDGDLSALLTSLGPMPADAALGLLAQVLEGLADAHSAGIVHRDIKPSNVLVRRTPSGLDALLCDLGVSLVLDADHTKTGGVVGTLGYMAPERHEGAPASVASDVYAVGCLLWAMLTGSAPYVGTDVRVAMGHLYGEIPQLTATSRVERDVNALVARAMAKDPAERFPSAVAMLEAVRRATPAPAPAPAPAPPSQRLPSPPPPAYRPVGTSGTASSSGRRRLVLPTVLLTVAVVVVAAIVVVTTHHGGGHHPVADPTSSVSTSTTPTGPVTSGGTASPSPTPDSATPGAVTMDASRSAGPAPAVAGARSGGTVTIHTEDGGPTDLDPSDGYGDLSGSILQSLVFRSLTQYATDPATGATVLVPDLATDLGTPSANGRAWTFTLRTGVRWQNGDPVTPQEIAFGIARSLDDSRFIGAPPYATEYLAGASTYHGPYDSHGAYRGVTISGDRLTIHLSTPFPDLPWYAASIAMGPVPLGHVSDPPAYGRRPWATGPYEVASFTPGKSLVLVRNPHWDPATDPARHAYPDRYVVDFDSISSEVDDALATGTPDAATSVTDSVDADDRARLDHALPGSVEAAPTSCEQYLAPDWKATGGGSTSGRLVRQAIAYGFDGPAYLQARRDGARLTDSPAASLLPPEVEGRDTNTPYSYDPAQARRLLAEAGYGPSHPFTLHMAYATGDAISVAQQKAMTYGFEKAGFQVDAKAYHGTSIVQLYSEPKNKLNAGLNLRPEGWCTDWPTGSQVVPLLLQSDQGGDYAHYSQPDTESAIEHLAVAPPDEQAAGWAELDRTLRAQLPLIPLFDLSELVAHGSRIGGFGVDPVAGEPYYKDLFVR